MCIFVTIIQAEATKAPSEASSAKDNAAAMESQLREAEEGKLKAFLDRN